MSDANMTAAINVSSMANRLSFIGLDPAWMGFHELAPEQKDDNDREQQINSREGGERNNQPGHRSHRIAGAHKAIDDPGLSSECSYEPAGLDCYQTERRGTNQRTYDPFVIGQPPRPPPDPSD